MMFDNKRSKISLNLKGSPEFSFEDLQYWCNVDARNKIITELWKPYFVVCQTFDLLKIHKFMLKYTLVPINVRNM